MEAFRFNPLSVWLGTCRECGCTQRLVVLADGPEAWCDMCGWSGLRFRLWRWLVRPFWTIGFLRWRARQAKEVCPPEPLVLHCPRCGLQHVDEGEWATRTHKTHLCAGCGQEWRPKETATVGVAARQSKGGESR